MCGNYLFVATYLVLGPANRRYLITDQYMYKALSYSDCLEIVYQPLFQVDVWFHMYNVFPIDVDE